MKTKIFAMYLPQFHEIPENSKFWGEGFTDWVSVKNSSPLFKNHIQPKVPLNENYYDLSLESNVLWQANIAKEHGIDGFGIYHYWFNNNTNLLTKPSEIIYNNKDIDINYFFVWDNASWKRTWSKIEGNDWAPVQDSNLKKEGTNVLVEYVLGNEKDWENHFNYLLKFFNDERYEKKEGKPIFVIYNYSSEILKMSKYWDSLAKSNGFNGMEFIYKYERKRNIPAEERCYFYEPINSGWTGFRHKVIQKIRKTLKFKGIKKYTYDKIWKKIIKNALNEKGEKNICGGFVNYDDSPRRGSRGRCIINGTPTKFGYYLKKLYDISVQNNKDYLFLTAWNEWGEGAYLEPDSINKYEYLEQIKKIKEKNK